jgi:hypothetical protein
MPEQRGQSVRSAKQEISYRLNIPSEGLTQAQKIIATAEAVRQWERDRNRLVHQLFLANEKIARLEMQLNP